jgi:hypothetical protein
MATAGHLQPIFPSMNKIIQKNMNETTFCCLLSKLGAAENPNPNSSFWHSISVTINQLAFCLSNLQKISDNPLLLP